MEDSSNSSAEKATKRTAESNLEEKIKRTKRAKHLEEEKRAEETRIARARIFERALNAGQENVEPDSPSASSCSSICSDSSFWNFSNSFSSDADDSWSDDESFLTGTYGDNGSML